MIPRLSSNSVSFASGMQNSVRSTYYANLQKNSKIAEKQTGEALNPAVTAPNLNAPIPMQGAGKKLDVQA